MGQPLLNWTADPLDLQELSGKTSVYLRSKWKFLVLSGLCPDRRLAEGATEVAEALFMERRLPQILWIYKNYLVKSVSICVQNGSSCGVNSCFSLNFINTWYLCGIGALVPQEGGRQK